jgi:hypothetical protein
MKNKWFPERFSEINKDKFILKKAYQVVEEEFPLIQFYYSNPFSNSIYLQFALGKANGKIIKSISKKLDEKEQISIQTGTIPQPSFTKIRKLINSLNINSFGLNDEFSDGRDGYYAELTIRRRFHSTTFSWIQIYMPSDWEVLNNIVTVLLEADKSVTYETIYTIGAEIFLEENNSSTLFQNKKSMLLEFKETKI